VEQAHVRSYELWRQVGETPKPIPVLQGLRRLYALRGDHGDGQRALELGDQLLTLAQRRNDTTLLQKAHWALGQTLCYLGELSPQCRTHQYAYPFLLPLRLILSVTLSRFKYKECSESNF
jgi:hypothetical protein